MQTKQLLSLISAISVLGKENTNWIQAQSREAPVCSTDRPCVTTGKCLVARHPAASQPAQHTKPAALPPLCTGTHCSSKSALKFYGRRTKRGHLPQEPANKISAKRKGQERVFEKG